MAARPSTPRLSTDTVSGGGGFSTPSASLSHQTRMGSQSVLDAATMAQLSAVDDFKRRHSKQNRDIIRENANRLIVNRNLQEEIGRLHVVILQEKEEKATIADQLRRAKEELARVSNDSARDALDAILSSVPALERLRYRLGKSSPTNSESRMENRRVEVEAWPAKPNVVDAGRPDLEAVTEMTERGSDSESVGGGAGPSSSRIAVRISRRRSPSPNPSVLNDELSARSSDRLASLDAETASTPLQPLPRARARRESGMFGRPESLEADSLAPAVTSTYAQSKQDATAPIEPVERRRISLNRRRRSILPSEAMETRVEVDQVELHAEGGQGAPGAYVGKQVDVLALVEEDEPYQASPPPFSSPIIPPPQDISHVESSPLTSIPASARTEITETEYTGDDGEGRPPARRARKSVNYKEPSLHTKMRKPGREEPKHDFVSAGLAPLSLTSLSRAMTPGASSRSVSNPLPQASPFTQSRLADRLPTPEEVEGDLDDSDVEAAITAMDARGAIVRRKSVLPKSRRESSLSSVPGLSNNTANKRATPTIPYLLSSAVSSEVSQPVRRRSVSASTLSSATAPSASSTLTKSAATNTLSDKIKGTTSTTSSIAPGPLSRRPFSQVENTTMSATSMTSAPAASATATATATQRSKVGSMMTRKASEGGLGGIRAIVDQNQQKQEEGPAEDAALDLIAARKARRRSSMIRTGL